MKTLFLCLLLTGFGVLPAVADVSDSSAVVYLSADDTLTASGQAFCEGETITTESGAMLRLPDGSDVELDARTTVEVRKLARAGGPTVTVLHVRRGAVRVNVPPRTTRSRTIFQVTTPVSAAGVRGTEFSVAYEPDASATAVDAAADVDVYEGTVEVDNGGARQNVAAGNGATVNRRVLRRRAVAQATRERWEARREHILDRVRARLQLGPDDDVAEKLREQLRQMPPEKREQILERIRKMETARRTRVHNRVENRQERRETIHENRVEHHENRVERRENRIERRTNRR